MKGYIQNEGTQAYFVCQRQIPPGGKVSFENIYKSVGKKSGMEKTNSEGIVLPLAPDQVLEFAEWIKTNVFSRGSWSYYVTGTTATAVSIIEAPYEEARGLIEKTSDRTVLKKALRAAQHFSHKDQHLRHLMKRLEQVAV